MWTLKLMYFPLMLKCAKERPHLCVCVYKVQCVCEFNARNRRMGIASVGVVLEGMQCAP